MGIFNSDSKQKKNELIMLQNIVLDIDEKKLQVSEEFLEKMTKIYISKYMKVVNEQAPDLTKTTTVALLFKKYDLIILNLEELIKIEPYYKFNRPGPTEFKFRLEASLPEYINGFISREWRKIKPINGQIRDAVAESKCQKFFDSFIPYESRLPQVCSDTLDKLRESVFGTSENKNEAPELSLESEFKPEEFPVLNDDNIVQESDSAQSGI